MSQTCIFEDGVKRPNPNTQGCSQSNELIITSALYSAHVQNAVGMNTYFRCYDSICQYNLRGNTDSDD